MGGKVLEMNAERRGVWRTIAGPALEENAAGMGPRPDVTPAHGDYSLTTYYSFLSLE
jgi:hypothetical protein